MPDGKTVQDVSSFRGGGAPPACRRSFTHSQHTANDVPPPPCVSPEQVKAAKEAKKKQREAV